MGDAVADLTDADALKLIGKTVGKWNKPENLMGAVWLLTGLAKQRSKAGDEVLAGLADDVSERDIYFGSAFIEALASAGRTDMGHLLPPLLAFFRDPARREHIAARYRAIHEQLRMDTNREAARAVVELLRGRGLV